MRPNGRGAGMNQRTTQATPARLPAAGGRGGGAPWASVGMPAEKSMNFGPSARRLLGRLRPQWMPLIAVVLLAIGSVTLSVISPKILGRATDVIFSGLIGQQLPAGTTAEQAAQGARAAGNDGFAELL